jgi:molybdopterin molybdotransferase
VPSVLRQLGVQEVFHKVAQRPGKPIWFGIGTGGQTVFGLPGNPVSALVCLLRYVVPALAALAGAPPRVVEYVPLGSTFKVKPALAYFLPVGLEHSPTTGLVAMPRPTRGSGDFIALLGTDGFAAGYLAPLFRW